MVVQHNLRAMNSNRMLGLTASVQSKSTEKLSSGYKINRAADDAAGLSISEKMRKQIRGLSQASLNAADGISAVQTAEGALNEVQDMLQRMNELAVKASNGTMSEDDRGYIQDEIDQLTTEINRVAETTKFNETYLLKGDKDSTSAVYGYARTKAEITDMNGDPVSLYDICGTKLSVEQTKAEIEKGNKVYKDDSAKDSFTESDDTNVEDDGTTYVKLSEDLYDKNGHLALKAGEVIKVADYDATDYCTDASDWANSQLADFDGVKDTANFALTDLYNADGTLAFKEGAEVTDDEKDDITNGKYSSTEITLGEEAVEGTDYKITEVKLFDKDGNGIAANGLESYFEKDEQGTMVYKGGLYDSNGDAVGTVGNTLQDDEDLSSFISKTDKAPGALSFKLHVGADATANNQIQLEISAMDAETLGIKGVSVDTEKDALSTIETVKAAIQKVSEQRSALGAVQNRLEHTIANLDNVVENTTAAESQIRDTDMATEMVKYSNNNILAQAGQAMLAQANQANQGVLSLLG